MTKYIDDIVIHEWTSVKPKGSIRIDKDDLDVEDFVGSEIYEDFDEELHEKVGDITSARLEDDKLIVNLAIEDDMLKEEYESVTLAPAFKGNLVENEDGEIIRLNETEVDNIGMFYNSRHEVEELTNNLGEKLNEEH